MPLKRACDLSAEQRAAIIRKMGFGATLNESLISQLAQVSTAIDYRRRRFVYRAGEAADSLYAMPARLEKLLLEFSDRYGVPETDGVLIDISLPHREIASIVGSTRESVTVRLNAMRREGIIDFVNRKILVKRPESLATA